MAMAPAHDLFFDEMFALADFLMDPIRIIGVQEIFAVRTRWPQLTWAADGTCNATMRQLLLSKDLTDVKEIDFHDPRAELQWDLNLPVPAEWHNSAHTLIDIGSIEHISRTNQVLENYLRMVQLGGLIAIHTPVKGFCNHGLHTFSPEFLPETLKANGCEIVYEKYSSDGSEEVQIAKGDNGEWMPRPFIGREHVLQWLVVRKFKRMVDYVTIQQGCY